MPSLSSRPRLSNRPPADGACRSCSAQWAPSWLSSPPAQSSCSAAATPASSDGKASATSPRPTPTPTPTPTTINGRQLLDVDPPQPKSVDDYIQTPGAWLTSRTYATGAQESRHRLQPDHRQARLDRPALRRALAGLRTVTSAGLVAVVFHATKDTHKSYCTRFAVIDVNKGVKVWEKPITDESVQPRARAERSRSATPSRRPVGPAGPAAYDTSTGAPAWNRPGRRLYPGGAPRR
ncbi:hypothetical protein ACRAWF_08115 [Streptomyces sp. L7]